MSYGNQRAAEMAQAQSGRPVPSICSICSRVAVHRSISINRYIDISIENNIIIIIQANGAATWRPISYKSHLHILIIYYYCTVPYTICSSSEAQMLIVGIDDAMALREWRRHIYGSVVETRRDKV